MHPQGPQPDQVPQPHQTGSFENMSAEAPQFSQRPANAEELIAAIAQGTPTEVMYPVHPNAETKRISEDMEKMGAVARGIDGMVTSQEVSKPQPGVTYTRQQQRDFR